MIRKIFKWLGVSLALIVLVAAVTYAVKVYNNRPKKVTEFQTIALGASMDEVAYALGVPPEVLKPAKWTTPEGKSVDALETVKQEELAKSKTIYKDYLFWQYPSPINRIDLSFDPVSKTVIEVGCYTSDEQRHWNACDVNGINVGLTEDQIIDQLGTPTRSEIDGISKRLDYDSWNMSVYLGKRVAYYIIVREMSKP